MRDLFLLASEIPSFCHHRGWRFCFIGGLALQRWGEPRLTGDIDLTILTGFGPESAYIGELSDRYAGRIADAADFAQRHRVLLLQSQRGVPIDVRLLTCSAEDLVVLKAFADRPRDWADIEGVLTRTGSRLDWHTIEAELQPLCEAKEAPHILPRLNALRTSS